MGTAVALLAGLALMYAGALALARWWWRFGRFQPRRGWGGIQGASRTRRSDGEADELRRLVYGARRVPRAGGRLQAAGWLLVAGGAWAVVAALAWAVQSA